MPVCYLDSNYDETFKCDYAISSDGIEICVERDIINFEPVTDGGKVFQGHINSKSRDILIIDHLSKRNILVKQACYAGYNLAFCTPDGGSKAKFRGSIYFEHNNYEQLKKLPQMPKATIIKVYSTAILDWIGTPKLEIDDTNNYLNYRLLRNNAPSSISIDSQNIKQISVSDSWTLKRESTSHVTIDFMGYIEIKLYHRVDYTDIYEYIYELLVFLQLYCPDRFSIQGIEVMIDNEFFQFSVSSHETEAQKEYALRTVKTDLLSFLKNCYTHIPYRKSKAAIRNIQYIVLQTSRGLEDNFLMFYRFIECYYKNRVPKSRGTFISSALAEHYVNEYQQLTDEEIDSFAQEIICLRNHYVHSGYYIKNSSLRISFSKIGEKKNSKDYTVNNIDADWLYKRTKMLYDVVIDIIFTKMLPYSEYKFSKHF